MRHVWLLNASTGSVHTLERPSEIDFSQESKHVERKMNISAILAAIYDYIITEIDFVLSVHIIELEQRVNCKRT